MKKLVVIVFLLSAFFSGFSQVLEPVKWSFSHEMTGKNEARLIFNATIEPGWHLYSQNMEDGGPVKTSFIFYNLKGFSFLDERVKIEEVEALDGPDTINYQVTFDEPEPEIERDPNFDNMLVKFFSRNTEFTKKIKIIDDKPLKIKGYVYFMCCDNQRCLPPNDNFKFSFEFNAPATASAVSAGAGSDIKQATEDRNIGTSANKSGLWFLFFASFIGGLLAIVTPCVFPMIPMTVTFFMHNSENKAKAKFQALVYGFSIIFIYTVIGTVVALTLGVNFANWLSTHWLPNVLFFLIFVIFAASFLGMFEITLPSWMINKTDRQADKGGFSGAFFMAFTLVLVSFSCTGPIVGAILVKSAGGQVLEPIIGMLGFSLAFALPFTLFAFFPSWLNNLPKSGGWLNSVKVVLGFLELALGLKFLSIADQTYHWGILDREVYLAFWIVIFALMGFYLLGKLKLSHDSDLPYLSVPRAMLAIVVFTFVVYMIPGMFGAPLKALSGYLPPQQTHDFDINAIVRDNIKIASLLSSEDKTERTELCEKPKYNDFLHLPHGLEGYFDYKQGLACAKALNKPVFIDFTGHGCVNCREMEANVWADPKVLKKLQNDFVIIALYVDDKTTLPEMEWIQSTVDGKIKKTLGKKFADFQISRFNVNAQPYYVLLDDKGELLVPPRAYSLNVEEFVNFLDAGIVEFKIREKQDK
jgi:thiol:disulfide interchange protein DsbD